MSNTTNNLERLIQMAAVEQMYAILQKMRENEPALNFPSSVLPKEQEQGLPKEQKQGLPKEQEQGLPNDALKELTEQREQINQLLETVSGLKLEIEQLRVLLQKQKEDDSDTMAGKNEMANQTLITDYKMFFKTETESIKLKIEEIPIKEEPDSEVDDELSVGEELGEHEELDTCVIVEAKEEKQETNDVQIKEIEVHEDTEEEVGTDEDEQKEPDKKPEVKEEEEDEEEEEEVFEIEIDDVTYFATGEENGVLYEMTTDGEVGKKVGIIKDGDVIFN